MADERAIRVAWERGDMRGASAAMLRELGPEILGYLNGVHGDSDVADDVFSAFCERVWSDVARFEWRCSARTWAYTLARRASIDHARAEQRRARRSRPIADAELAEIAAHVRSTTEPFLRTSAKTALAGLRERLPDDDRALLTLRVDRGLSWNDLARVFLDEATEVDDDALRREAARLRKRFQLVKERLRAWIDEAGLLPDKSDR